MGGFQFTRITNSYNSGKNSSGSNNKRPRPSIELESVSEAPGDGISRRSSLREKIVNNHNVGIDGQKDKVDDGNGWDENDHPMPRNKGRTASMKKQVQMQVREGASQETMDAAAESGTRRTGRRRASPQPPSPTMTRQVPDANDEESSSPRATRSSTRKRGLSPPSSPQIPSDEPLVIEKKRKSGGGSRSNKAQTRTEEDQGEQQEFQSPSERHASKVALPVADTPVMQRNKKMRQKKGKDQRRRSSLGMRGRRASSLIDSGASNGGCFMDFYCYIDKR